MSEGKIISDLEKVDISMKIRSIFYHLKQGFKIFIETGCFPWLQLPPLQRVYFCLAFFILL